MEKSKRMNTLLVEILIVLLFFMLASTVLLNVFAGARQLSALAQARGAALEESQNVAEQLYAAEDIPALLQGMGFAQAEDAWRCDRGQYVLTVTCTEDATPAGVLMDMAVTARRGDEVLFTLPCSVYREEAAHE